MRNFWEAWLLIAVIFICFGVAVFYSPAQFYTPESKEIDVSRLCDAIYKAEGGEKATYLYGIRSVHYANPSEARKICINSINNNIKRWDDKGKPEDFISFMSRRYCPIGADNDPNGLNVNWVKNVRYFYERGE